MTHAPRPEATVSIRLFWPFARALADDPAGEGLLGNLLPPEFSDPDTRIPHRTTARLLENVAAKARRPGLGIRAGEQTDPADFDVVEHVARAAKTLGDAMRAMARYVRILHEAAEITIADVHGGLVEWRYRVTDGVRQPPAANEFCIAAALGFSRRNAVEQEPPMEIGFMHPRPPYAADYERLCANVKFDCHENVIVVRRERLETPLLRANRPLSGVFGRHAERLLKELEQRESVSGRVRAEVASQLRNGTVSMQLAARHLAMSAATLRRRLQDEGTTFSGIVDDLRRHLAEQYLSEPGTAVSEAAFLLGFASVTAFARAFRRWRGISPTEFRAARNV